MCGWVSEGYKEKNLVGRKETPQLLPLFLSVANHICSPKMAQTSNFHLTRSSTVWL